MSKKRIDDEAVLNELRGGSVFFRPSSNDEEKAQRSEVKKTETIAPQTQLPTVPKGEEHLTQSVIPRHRDTMVARHHDTIIEKTRKAVKHIGKEAATHRFTVEEKKALKKVEQEYYVRDIRTSENEITRIAINYILEDYKKHGQESVLAEVLKLLNT